MDLKPTPATNIQKKQLDALINEAKKSALKETMADKNSFDLLLRHRDVLREDLIALFAMHAAGDKKFELVNSFRFTVPADYIHDKQLTLFAALRQKKMAKARERERQEEESPADLADRVVYYNSHLTDHNYMKATGRLIPGKAYGGRIFQIKPGLRATSPECLQLLVRQKAILVGAQGISLVQQLKKDVFPRGKWTISFDEERGLWRAGCGDLRVPGMCPDADGWRFGLSSFEGDWGEANCLLCVYDLDT